MRSGTGILPVERTCFEGPGCSCDTWARCLLLQALRDRAFNRLWGFSRKRILKKAALSDNNVLGLPQDPTGQNGGLRAVNGPERQKMTRLKHDWTENSDLVGSIRSQEKVKKNRIFPDFYAILGV
jgi:hypothetical protein